MQTISSTILALLAASTTACLSEQTEGADDVIELVPSDGKVDGSAAVHVELRAPGVVKFEVVCNEWFSCDLKLGISQETPFFVGVDVVRLSDGARFRFSQRTLKCGEGYDWPGLWPLGQLDGASCNGVKHADISSENANEIFQITAYITEPKGGSFGIYANWF